MTASTAQPSRLPNQQPKRDFLSSVTSKGSGLPSRVILHGVEGVGKTSWAACAPKPIFLMARGETGLETLIDTGSLGDIPHFPETMTWTDAMGSIEQLAKDDHDYKTLVIDTLNGLERLCHEHVCKRDYRNSWGKDGFASYQAGFDTSLTDWRELLTALDNLRQAKRMAIICLCHTQVKTFKNPLGTDYDRYQPAVHDKTWNLTHRWADFVLFANFHVEVSKEGGRGKGQGGQSRVIYTVKHAAYDAKRRCDLPDEIDMGTSGKTGFVNFMAAMKAAKGTEN